MKKRKHLQTDFVKFILEKYSQEGQELPDEDEIETPDDDDDDDEFQRKRKNLKKLNEFDDEDEIDDEENDGEDEQIIDELLNEYKRLKKKYESNKLSYRRKR